MSALYCRVCVFFPSLIGIVHFLSFFFFFIDCFVFTEHFSHFLSCLSFNVVVVFFEVFSLVLLKCFFFLDILYSHCTTDSHCLCRAVQSFSFQSGIFPSSPSIFFGVHILSQLCIVDLFNASIVCHVQKSKVERFFRCCSFRNWVWSKVNECI